MFKLVKATLRNADTAEYRHLSVGKIIKVFDKKVKPEYIEISFEETPNGF